uniref:Poly(A) RNA polymerase, mitochondrial n=1 Tax=Graphocephala atropunctata TaxID=36148 RepID=A0A1B6MF47_9HEMI
MLFIGLISKRFNKFLPIKIALLKEECFQSRFNFHTRLSIGNRYAAQASGTKRDEKFSVELFDKQVERRRQQAQRSIVVQVQSEQSCAQLCEYCSQFGNIASMYHYTASNSTMHFILMEFNNVETVTEVMKACGHNDRSQIIPTYSRMLWFRAKQKKKVTSNSSKANIPLVSSAPPVTRQQLYEWLGQTDSVSDQLKLLYEATRLDELGVRLRFVTAHQLEVAVSGLFPRAQVLLFGSSVNGFGRRGCDLDLVLQLDQWSEEEDSKCRLMFHAKPSVNARSQTQRHIDGLADLVQWFLPGCTDVRRILLARVPIVKYRQEFTDVECDLSLTNMTAVYMSELLYTLGAADWRLQPLAFTVRRWAAEVGLSNPSPGRWITNFSLTLLVIFYLQRSRVLPSLDTLRHLAGKTDRRITEDGVNCSFLRDITQLSPSDNTSNLESLLLGFFEYYAAFDFATQGISLGTGAPIKKRDHAALYIANPLETHLNVSQNVSLEETERLRIEFRNAAWELESSTDGEEVDRTNEWGLLRLFKDNQLAEKTKQLEQFYSAPKRRHSSRLIVSKLFEDEQEEQNKSKTSRSIQKTIVR